MDKQMMTEKRFSEFNYSEDTQMALNDALYDNDFSWDSVRSKAVDKAVSIIFIPFLALSSPDGGVYEKAILTRVEQCDAPSLLEGFQHASDPIIERSGGGEEESSPYNKLLSFVRNLSSLPKDMPGLGFEVPSKLVLDNTEKFLIAMESSGIACPEMENVSPTEFGTIVIDALVDRGLISMEIGRTKIGFFTNFEDGINEESDGISTDFHSVPKVLLNHLRA